jgi:16S rRNA pseudouridine516 synthase
MHGVSAHAEPLDRFLARRLKLTWAAVHELVHRNRVSVAGALVRQYHRPLAAGEVVQVDGAVLADGPDDSVILCHKPVGVACSHDPDDAPLIYDVVPAELCHPNLQTVGRLDRNTSGFLLLTIDGKLIQRLTDPRSKLPKRYRIGYAGTLESGAVERVAAGLVLADTGERCLPADLSCDAPGRATLVLTEGRFHQVKRMIQTLGARVETLHRDRLGDWDLPADLQPGAMRLFGIGPLSYGGRE